MKKLLPLLLLLLVSCKTIKQLGNQEIKTNHACLEMLVQNKQPIVEVEVDGKKVNFLFDTGAGLSVLIDSAVIADFHAKDFGTFGSTGGSDGKKIKNRFFTASFNSPLFSSKNKALLFANMPKTDCSKPYNFAGILGLDIFLEEGYVMMMDFTKNSLCNITDAQKLEFIKANGYQKIKADCKNNQVFIYAVIEGKEYKFKLDTGSTGSFTIPSTDKLKISNPNKMELDGMMYASISSLSNGKEFLYEKMDVQFGNLKIPSKLAVSGSVKAQLVGMEFIKGFDWIIDNDKNEVWIKRNEYAIPSDFTSRTTYRANTKHGKLYIALKEKSQTKFKLNDQIVSVDATPITPDNACEYQEILNKSADWNSFEIITAKPAE